MVLMILTSGKVYFSAFLVCWENLQIYYSKQCRKNNYFMEKSVNIITINIFSETTKKYTLTFEMKVRRKSIVETDKILKYLEKDYVAKSKKTKFSKKECILAELEALKKERFTTAELECLLDCYQIKQQESNNKVTFMLAIVTAVLACVSVILAGIVAIPNILQGNNLTVGNLWGIFIGMVIMSFLPATVACFILWRITKTNNTGLYYRMIAIELLLATKEEKER